MAFEPDCVDGGWNEWCEEESDEVLCLRVYGEDGGAKKGELVTLVNGGEFSEGVKNLWNLYTDDATIETIRKRGKGGLLS